MSTPQYKWRVKRSEHGVTLENFVYKQLGDWSHKQVKDAIDKKRAFVNGRNVFISKWNVKRNDLVMFAPSQSDLPTHRSEGGQSLARSRRS
jgi:23S rRNA-/tRNA-specific pseudouridylate synthase